MASVQSYTHDRETFDGPLADENLTRYVPGTVPSYGYWDNVGNWLCMLEAWEDDSKRRDFVSLLSTPQRDSFRLLREWWNNGRQDQGEVYRKWIITPDPGTSTIPPPNPPHFPWVEAPSRPKPTMSGSQYNDVLFMLWWTEFAGYDSDHYNASTSARKKNLMVLLQLRRKAAAIAAVHRVADISYKRLSQPWGITHGPAVENVADSASSVEDIPACIHPCPWIEAGKGSDNWPFYLWDKQKNCTVSIAEFEEQAPYIVISHTWGRWRLPKRDAGDDARPDAKDDAFVTGVPWLVPRNSLFSVENLPDILSRVPSSTRYIWFDLVCIPQDKSVRQQLEIAKQAKIFAAAKESAIWFNTITSWSGLQATLDWLGLEYLKVNNAGGYQVASILKKAAKAASASTALVAPCAKDGKEYQIKFRSRKMFQRKLEPVGWFTSLWTLQEACIRPDMWLCDRNWNVLRADEKLPIPLDYIVALFNTSFALWGKGENQLHCPDGPYEIAAILTHTGLHKLLDMTPVDAIIFGNQRYCEDRRRPEAIMSVLDCTTWYRERIETTVNQGSTPSGSTDILLEGKYPLDFVKEVRQKLGALFFTANTVTRFANIMYQVDSQNRISDTRIRATMMPFTSFARSQRLSAVDNAATTDDHPAVRTWKVREDGSVKMHLAGVVASWPATERTKIKAMIKATPAGFSERQSIIGEYDLVDWLGSFRPNAEKHAICLLRNSETICYGILLERIYLEPAKTTFLNVGNFWFDYKPTPGDDNSVYPFSESREVDWEII
ncbi:hypothetical protein BP6252_06780 [Coleophoma cylindrospora]|uniref:Heterokaryon incompatibility domain-containing protein n=1 Tax=Coleophoma cylindrospora TaxID=1849047 RepID=A0A3D8RFN8_9HELO|nr:hypothetical protein BP6252_06780 [Coleophoma cylindrospora]